MIIELCLITSYPRHYHVTDIDLLTTSATAQDLKVSAFQLIVQSEAELVSFDHAPNNSNYFINVKKEDFGDSLLVSMTIHLRLAHVTADGRGVDLSDASRFRL